MNSFFSHLQTDNQFAAAVILAAGKSVRMGEDKLSFLIDGVPLPVFTIRKFQECERIREIAVVVSEDKLDLFAEYRQQYGLDKVKHIVIGGSNRTESAYLGVFSVSKRSSIICIHDCARPFVSPEVILDSIHNAVLYHACAPAIPVHDTIKIVSNGIVIDTPERASLQAVQTPQAFRSDLIRAALQHAKDHSLEFTDDCCAVESIGVCPRLFSGSRENIKLTEQADLALVRSMFPTMEVTRP